MTKNNPLVKKGIPTFPTNKEPEQIVHPVIEKEVPEVKTNNSVNTNAGTGNNFEGIYTPPVKIEKKQVSIYLDQDVIEAFNEFGKQYGKGAKSDLVNSYLRNILLGENK